MFEEAPGPEAIEAKEDETEAAGIEIDILGMPDEIDTA